MNHKIIIIPENLHNSDYNHQILFFILVDYNTQNNSYHVSIVSENNGSEATVAYIDIEKTG